MWGAIAAVAGKIADWAPNKKERYRAKIRSLERKMDDILKNKEKLNAGDAHRYQRYAEQLRLYEDKIADI